ncbi:amidohydrolase [Amycolatopsis sp. CA-230715]|uniref:amidohydrolase n=1 Tax=Amycolatopsis sp. CA-230715 TaxID=2745196 RepID=UPI001C00A8A3|nr:amidohydrolase [Amycolatopsis sp. CA-230715]QWF84135.1 N-substituted formamide deformylase [Amycolatopsis sp. CA-230715]
MTASQTRIFTAGTVHTMTGTTVPAFAAFGETIVATGEVATLRTRFPEAEVHDFGNAVLLPGFNDAHQHPSIMAEQLLEVDCSPELVGSRAELLAKLAERATTTPPGHWVIGCRYDHAKSTGGTVLTRAELDRVCPDHPVFLRQIGMHWGVLNTVGLRAAGLNESTELPPGGELGRDAAGRLDGTVYERAMFELVEPAIPERGTDERLAGLRRYQRMMHAAGITSVGDALVWPRGLRLLQEAHARQELTLRVSMLLAYSGLDAMGALGLRTGLGDTRLRIGGVKAFVDGAVAGGTCLLEEPYADSCGHGIQAMPTEELADFVSTVHRAGSTVCVHANGDRAIRLLLDAVEAAQRAHPRPHARHRIEHCTLVDPGLLARIAALGLIAVPFGSYVAFHGEKLPGYYGRQRAERMFPHRALLDAGVPVAGSSDFPCGPYDVRLALRSCVTRRTADGTVLGEDQRISQAEALALYTTGAAYASGEEHRKGTIAEGMLADFVVLDRDPFHVPGEELTEIEVEQTWVGAERVWSREPS